MTIGVRTSTGLKDIGEVWLRTSGGLKQIGEVWLRTAAGLKQVFGAFSATASPDVVVGSTSSHGAVAVSTNATTVTPNPPGSATYSWGSGGSGWTVLNPSSATTAFRYSGLTPGDSQNTTFTCTVTRGALVAHADVTAQVDNYGL